MLSNFVNKIFSEHEMRIKVLFEPKASSLLYLKIMNKIY